MGNNKSEATIEDKLRETLNLLLPIYAESYILENTRVRKQVEINRMIQQIQAIITTETKQARIAAIASYKKVLKLEAELKKEPHDS